jgi:hypothetical protein
MKHNGTLLGRWVVRVGGDAQTLLARVEDELYLLAFSSAVRADACARALGASGRPFYVCSANLQGLIGEARGAGARGFIVDYDAGRAAFASAHALPVPGEGEARELR